jgi:hypothetical protein
LEDGDGGEDEDEGGDDEVGNEEDEDEEDSDKEEDEIWKVIALRFLLSVLLVIQLLFANSRS